MMLFTFLPHPDDDHEDDEFFGEPDGARLIKLSAVIGLSVAGIVLVGVLGARASTPPRGESCLTQLTVEGRRGPWLVNAGRASPVSDGYVARPCTCAEVAAINPAAFQTDRYVALPDTSEACAATSGTK